MLDYYNTAGVRAICHKVKKSDISAISAISSYLSRSLSSSSILIPAPSHIGCATYTLEICKEIRRRKGNKIADILKRTSSESLYEMKLKGKGYVEMFLTKNVENGHYLFVDNVISTGLTFNTAKALIPNLSPLVFAHV